MTTTTPAAVKPFYSATEAAAILGVAQQTIHRWCRLGLMKTQRVGERGHFRIPASSIFKTGVPPAAPASPTR
jgi:excisionase family DNA binding protein